MPDRSLLITLAGLLELVTEGRIDISAHTDGEADLREFGVDSLSLLNLLVAIEDELGFEWDPETPASTFRSLASIADFLAPALRVANSA